MSPVPSLALVSRFDPRRIVLRDVEPLELCPRGDCLCTRHRLIRCEELGDEVDVATVRDLLEAFHLVQGDVLPDEVAVSWVLAARGLFLSPAIQAIPDSGLLTNQPFSKSRSLIVGERASTMGTAYFIRRRRQRLQTADARGYMTQMKFIFGLTCLFLPLLFAAARHP